MVKSIEGMFRADCFSPLKAQRLKCLVNTYFLIGNIHPSYVHLYLTFSAFIVVAALKSYHLNSKHILTIFAPYFPQKGNTSLDDDVGIGSSDRLWKRRKNAISRPK